MIDTNPFDIECDEKIIRYNTPKGRNSLKEIPGAYTLKGKNGEDRYHGHTNNLQRRIKEHHWDKKKRFSLVECYPTKCKADAELLERKLLCKGKTKYNKSFVLCSPKKVNNTQENKK